MLCFVFIIASLIPILRICPFVMKFVNKITGWKLLQQIVEKNYILKTKQKSVAYVWFKLLRWRWTHKQGPRGIWSTHDKCVHEILVMVLARSSCLFFFSPSAMSTCKYKLSKSFQSHTINQHLTKLLKECYCHWKSRKDEKSLSKVHGHFLTNVTLPSR